MDETAKIPQLMHYLVECRRPMQNRAFSCAAGKEAVRKERRSNGAGTCTLAAQTALVICATTLLSGEEHCLRCPLTWDCSGGHKKLKTAVEEGEGGERHSPRRRRLLQ